MKGSIYASMSRETARHADSMSRFLLCVFGAFAFGGWQHSWLAGVFGYALLDSIANIGWAIEWGDQTESHRERISVEAHTK